MKIENILSEAKKKKDDEPPVEYIETDPEYPFPENTMKDFKREINKRADDPELEWNNAIELVNSIFEDSGIPLPKVFQKEKWRQYEQLLSKAVEDLKEARGLHGSWTTTV